jgi:hypothetical protein
MKGLNWHDELCFIRLSQPLLMISREEGEKMPKREGEEKKYEQKKESKPKERKLPMKRKYPVEELNPLVKSKDRDIKKGLFPSELVRGSDNAKHPREMIGKKKSQCLLNLSF